MEREREDWEAPALPKPVKLTAGEQLVVIRELRRGASLHALADYFGTSYAEIEALDFYRREDGRR
jgi:hypothetical protein